MATKYAVGTVHVAADGIHTVTNVYEVPGMDVLEIESDIGGTTVTSTICAGDEPWKRDETLRVKLENAGWRYAAIIGIVDADDAGCADTIEADRVKYAALIHKAPDGKACWECKEATTFVCELTGASREVAAAWLNLDWFGGGEV